MRWTARCKPEDQTYVSELSTATGLSTIAAHLLVARGITSPEHARLFLSPRLEHLHSPYLMLGMKAAVERLRAAIQNKEKVLIYGDYDVDGTTAVVVLKTAIEICGGACEFHIPHRLREGYGMRDEVIERAAADGVRLIISVDTGIRAFAAAETCQRLGLDLIVTDHHLPEGGNVPQAVAVLNPNQVGCEYPCKALCGAGVAFKVAHALLERHPDCEKLLISFLKVVAIATVADAVPLTGENRVFVKLGLDGLRSPVNPGLRALMQVAELTGAKGRPITSGDVAFRLAPRLNAAGRMDIAKDVVDLFTIKDAKLAAEIAGRLNALNIERQAEEARILTEITQAIESDKGLREAYCIVVDGDGWHKGVIGIVASRIVDRHHRPVLVISREGEMAQGSARSIEAFHLMEALESCGQLFTRFGGHAHAAGFALESANIPQLRSAMEDWARTKLSSEDLEPALSFDSEIGLDDVTPQLYEAIKQLEPFGMGNPMPVFVARAAQCLTAPKVLKEKHAKLRVRQSNSDGKAVRSFDALAWRMAERVQRESLIAGDVVDLAFTIEENTHPEFGGLQLSVCDFVKVNAKVAAGAGVGKF